LKSFSVNVRAKIERNYKTIRQNRLFMKSDHLVVGLIVLAFAAILLADAILTTVDPASQLFSPNDVKGMVGMVFVVLAALYFKAAKNETTNSFSFLLSFLTSKLNH